VSFWDAARFCNWLHNGQGNGDTESGAYLNVGDQNTFMRKPGAKYFIPTENEWYKAAYHKNDGVTGNYFDFPTRSDVAPSKNVRLVDPGNNANFYDDGGYTIGLPFYLTVVGEFEKSYSPYYTFDQGGNLFEWDETSIGGSLRGARGGSWGHPSYCLDRSVRHYSRPALFDENYIGFRVARIPEPGTITLLACGAVVALALWRRRR
ncbi:MAG: SUMF1/EgtB/PvdO family nonheme iron enzyme, partial [Pirellulales bacterium]|nr:SUMF1/EgtB/PvdO family nonheme iron enzyme [Pirellulales bacterium]